MKGIIIFIGFLVVGTFGEMSAKNQGKELKERIILEDNRYMRLPARYHEILKPRLDQIWSHIDPTVHADQLRKNSEVTQNELKIVNAERESLSRQMKTLQPTMEELHKNLDRLEVEAESTLNQLADNQMHKAALEDTLNRVNGELHRLESKKISGSPQEFNHNEIWVPSKFVFACNAATEVCNSDHRDQALEKACDALESACYKQYQDGPPIVDDVYMDGKCPDFPYCWAGLDANLPTFFDPKQWKIV